MATRSVDLGEFRRNLTRFALVQAVILAGILVLLLMGSRDPTHLRRMLWVAAFPLLFGLWTYLYYRTFKSVEASGGSLDAYRNANRRALALLGTFAALWAVGFVVVAFWP